MSSPVISENLFLLYSFLMGIFITFIYDIFRIFRRVCPHKRFAVSLEDIMFWIFCAISVFYLMHTQSNGTLRWFAVLGAMAGMFLYKKLLSDFLVKWVSVGLSKMLGFLGKILHVLGTPFRVLGEKSKKATGRAKEGGKRFGAVVKKRLTGFIKLLKIALCKQ
ncbi:MAG: spore cortex biosynthesis protein YabQ [Lachnospiraceae bacterium]|nr:spore cortex biosynthesis protein YabQ [Lachnospiraceae bacterium]